jgi:hypothetical protein
MASEETALKIRLTFYQNFSVGDIEERKAVGAKKIGGRHCARAATSPQVQNRMVEILRMCAFKVSNRDTVTGLAVKPRIYRQLSKRLRIPRAYSFHDSGSLYEKLEIRCSPSHLRVGAKRLGNFFSVLQKVFLGSFIRLVI